MNNKPRNQQSYTNRRLKGYVEVVEWNYVELHNFLITR